MSDTTPDLLTITQVATACGVRTHQARYAADEYRIQPDQRAGIIRLWKPDRVDEFRSALRRIAGRREFARG